MSNAARRVDLVSNAVSYIGTPFKHQGRKPGRGLDCAGLIVCAAQAAGWTIKPSKVYGTRPRPIQLRAELERWCEEAEDDGSPGLIHLMRPRNGLRVCHYVLRVDEYTTVQAVVHTSVQLVAYAPDLVDSTWVLREPI